MICDSLAEIERLDAICADAGRRQDVLIRVTPGVEADTHSYIQTGQLDSKFGLGLADGLAARGDRGGARGRATSSSSGSTRTSARRSSSSSPTCGRSRRSAELADPAWCRLLNVGGGLGIAYTAADEPPSIDAYAEVKVARRRAASSTRLPRILVEPGRSLVGNAGITAYTVGTVKEIPGVRTYVAVDGGMSDNLRPMLYGSRYEAMIADRAGEPADDAR